MKELRDALRSQSTEVKAKQLLAPRASEILRALLEDSRLRGRTNIYLAEKRFFLHTKMMDLVIEEKLFANGTDLHAAGGGGARRYAEILYLEGPRLGADWERLLQAFNSLVRAKVRKGTRASASDVMEAVRNLTPLATGILRNLLEIMAASREQIDELANNAETSAVEFLTLDPTLLALGASARTMTERAARPIHFTHDQATVLTSERIRALQQGLTLGHHVIPGIRQVRVTGVKLVDSRDDDRVQVADILAGIARAACESELRGAASPYADLLRPHLDPLSLWGDAPSGRRLGLF